MSSRLVTSTLGPWSLGLTGQQDKLRILPSAKLVSVSIMLDPACGIEGGHAGLTGQQGKAKLPKLAASGPELPIILLVAPREELDGASTTIARSQLFTPGSHSYKRPKTQSLGRIRLSKTKGVPVAAGSRLAKIVGLLEQGIKRVITTQVGLFRYWCSHKTVLCKHP